MWGHWYPLFWTSDDSTHEFQSQGGSIIACALLSLGPNDPQSHLWLPGLGIDPGSLVPEASRYHCASPTRPEICRLAPLTKEIFERDSGFVVVFSKNRTLPRHECVAG